MFGSEVMIKMSIKCILFVLLAVQGSRATDSVDSDLSDSKFFDVSSFDSDQYTSQPLIVGGIQPRPHQFPWLVSIQWKASKLTKYRHICGGTIVGLEWILTAASCVPKVGKLIVKAGKHNLAATEKGEEIREVKLSIKHKDYRPASLRNKIPQNNLALLKLRKPLIIEKELTAQLELATESDFDSELFDGTEFDMDSESYDLIEESHLAEDSELVPKSDLTSDNDEEFRLKSREALIAGWGGPIRPTRVLQAALVPRISRKSCSNILQVAYWGKAKLGKNQICTGPIGGKISACAGDIGGPLVKRGKNGKPVLLGVLTWNSRPCGLRGAPTVSTSILRERTWIKKQMDDSE